MSKLTLKPTPSPSTINSDYSSTSDKTSTSQPPPQAFKPTNLISVQRSGSTSESCASQLSQIDYVNKLAHRIAEERNGSSQVVDEKQKSKEATEVIYKFGLRVGFAPTDTESKVITNYLTLRTPKQLFVYSLEMIRGISAQGRPEHVKKPWDRLAVLQALQNPVNGIGQVLNAAGNLNKWVSDGALIWSVADLFPTQNLPITVANTQYVNESGRTLVIQSVTLSFSRHLDLSNANVAQLFYDATSPKYQDSVPGVLTRGLNAFLTKHVRNRAVGANPQVTITSANRSFAHITGFRMGQGQDQNVLRGMQGYFLSVRPGFDRLLLNISHATSAFFENLTVLDFICRCNTLRRSDAEIKGILRGVKVAVSHSDSPPTPTNRIRFIASVGEHVNSQVYNTTATPTMTVLQHYERNLPQHTVSNDPRNWAIDTGVRGQEQWYTADQLKIQQWCRFNGRLQRDETSSMITSAQKKAIPHRDGLLNAGLQHFGLRGPQTFLQPVGMNVSTDFLSIPARWLPAPKIVYRNATTTPDKSKWDLRKKKFWDQGRINKIFALNASGNSLPHNFGSAMSKALSEHVLHRQTHPNQPPIPLAERTFAPQNARAPSLAWEGQLLSAVQGFPSGQILMVVMREKSFDEYASIKRVLDTKLGIQSICVTQSAMKGEFGLQGQMASNLALKHSFKSKLDSFKFDDDVLRALRQGDTADTIVLGADVAHPGVGSKSGTPSIAAVVGTHDNRFTQFGGSMRLQRGRREDIVRLDSMVWERLVAFALKHDKQLPKKVLFYRDGVSESQYDIIRRRELPQIQNAMNEALRSLQKHRGQPVTAPPCLPPPDVSCMRPEEEKAALEKWASMVESQEKNVPFKMTFVVVGKRHNTRFYPTRADQHLKPQGGAGKPNDNVKPGLCVDQVICHPFATDFYLQSHEPIQGAGKSAHYFVLQNNMELTIDQLQSITHTFCYDYARTTRGVSYCAPAYYADRLCDRGRAYLRHFLINSTQGIAIAQTHNPQPADDYPELRNYPTYQAYMEACARHIASRADYFRGWASQNPQLRIYDRPRENPWHPNLDDTMFWL